MGAKRLKRVEKYDDVMRLSREEAESDLKFLGFLIM